MYGKDIQSRASAWDQALGNVVFRELSIIERSKV